jgi:hypothetical protein
MERFILAQDADVKMPTGKRHLDAGTPVAFNALGMQYAKLKDKLRAEDPCRDKPGRAGPPSCSTPCRSFPPATREGCGTYERSPTSQLGGRDEPCTVFLA